MNFFYGIEVERQAPKKPVARMDDPTYKGMLWKSTQKKRDSFEGRFVILFRTVLNSYYKELANKITTDNMRSDIFQIENEKIENAFISLYTVVGKSFARDQFVKHKALKKDISEDEWFEWLKNYVLTKAGKKIVSIAGETKRQAIKIIQSVLDMSVAEGLGADQTAVRIKDALITQGTEINKWRALRIARTEIMTASNVGAQLGAQSTGLAMKKFWIATYDTRTRDTHLEVEGQNPKAMDEGFRVGAYMMEMPGDPDAGPEEVINCRCAIAYEVI